MKLQGIPTKLKRQIVNQNKLSTNLIDKLERAAWNEKDSADKQSYMFGGRPDVITVNGEKTKQRWKKLGNYRCRGLRLTSVRIIGAPKL